LYQFSQKDKLQLTQKDTFRHNYHAATQHKRM